MSLWLGGNGVSGFSRFSIIQFMVNCFITPVMDIWLQSSDTEFRCCKTLDNSACCRSDNLTDIECHFVCILFPRCVNHLTYQIWYQIENMFATHLRCLWKKGLVSSARSFFPPHMERQGRCRPHQLFVQRWLARKLRIQPAHFLVIRNRIWIRFSNDTFWIGFWFRFFWHRFPHALVGHPPCIMIPRKWSWMQQRNVKRPR